MPSINRSTSHGDRSWTELRSRADLPVRSRRSAARRSRKASPRRWSASASACTRISGSAALPAVDRLFSFGNEKWAYHFDPRGWMGKRSPRLPEVMGLRSLFEKNILVGNRKCGLFPAAKMKLANMSWNLSNGSRPDAHLGLQVKTGSLNRRICKLSPKTPPKLWCKCLNNGVLGEHGWVCPDAADGWYICF